MSRNSRSASPAGSAPSRSRSASPGGLAQKLKNEVIIAQRELAHLGTAAGQPHLLVAKIGRYAYDQYAYTKENSRKATVSTILKSPARVKQIEEWELGIKHHQSIIDHARAEAQKRLDTAQHKLRDAGIAMA